jgi:hypothetical protein
MCVNFVCRLLQTEARAARLVPKCRMSGQGERLGRSGSRLILRSKMATLLRVIVAVRLFGCGPGKAAPERGFPNPQPGGSLMCVNFVCRLLQTEARVARLAPKCRMSGQGERLGRSGSRLILRSEIYFASRDRCCPAIWVRPWKGSAGAWISKSADGWFASAFENLPRTCFNSMKGQAWGFEQG